MLGESLSQNLGQQVVIENVGGAGGTIGATRVARAAPDGYTVLLHQPGLAASMTLYPKLTFDAEKDFIGIGLINTSASIMAGRATLPPNNVAELLSWMKEPGRTTTMAHAGVGAFGHLCGCCSCRSSASRSIRSPTRAAARRSTTSSPATPT